MDGTKVTFILCFMLSSFCYSKDSTLVNKWKNIVSSESQGHLDINNQAFCYIDQSGEIRGHNINSNLGIASVSKLLTTLWALSKLGEDHQFETKVYYNQGNLHIEGGKDPVFSRRSLYFLINQLNKHSITEIKNLTYDENFYFVPQAIDNPTHSSVFTSQAGINYCKYYEPTVNEFKPLLEKYLNTDKWMSHQTQISNASLDSSGTKCLKMNVKSIKEDYQQKRKNFYHFQENPKLNVQNIYHLKNNPFVTGSSIKKGTKVFTLKSSKLIDIIKFINVFSANLPADLIFHNLGGNSRFVRDLSAILLTIDRSSFENFISGSGIPYKFNENGRWTRIVNTANCKTVLSILELFIKQSNGVRRPLFSGFEPPIHYKHDFISKFFLAVGGIEGTVARRFTGHAKTIIAKTGTLNDSSSLAGTINSTGGKKHFVLLNTFPLSAASPELVQISKNIQNQAINVLFTDEGPKESFRYSPSGNLDISKFYSFDRDVSIKEI